MKLNITNHKSISTLILGAAVAALFTLSISGCVVANRSSGSAMLRPSLIRIVDGSESNGGKGDKPKHQSLTHVA